MKLAIFHSFLDNIGGAEIVTLTLARELNADIYTTNIDHKKILKMGFASVLPRIKSIGRVPLNAPYRQQLTWLLFRLLNLKDRYDFFIIGHDWAMSAAVHNKPNIWYVHSPIREIWDLYPYIKNVIMKKSKVKIVYDLWVLFNRYFNKKEVRRVNKILCNSKNTQARIKKYLHRNSIVVNPPTDTSKYYHKKSGNYWLSVNRLYYHKRVDMQVKAFSKLQKENLIIVGCYEKSWHFEKYAKYILGIKPKNVKILNWIGDTELVDLYAGCKGLITTASDEDFGMTPIEAMASGKPVIAANEGGYKETVINGKTGTLIDNINEDKLIKAIKKISSELEKNPYSYKAACVKQSRKFNTSIFIKKIRQEMKL